MLATERDQHLKRIWWSPSVDVEPKVYLTRVVNFGKKTAGTVAVTTLRLTAEIFGDQTINGVKKLVKYNVVTGKDMKMFREKLRRDDFKSSEEENTYLPKIPDNLKSLPDLVVKFLSCLKRQPVPSC